MTKIVEAAPWSFSKIHAFEQCPLQFYEERVLKLHPQEESAAMHYGTLFHTAAEEYIGDDTPLPKKFEFAKASLDKLNEIEGEKLVEQKMGLTVDLEPCGFYDADVWWRGIADLNIVDGSLAYTIDYKTGSKKSVAYADKGQLELMTLAVFAHYPDVETVRAALFFVIGKAFIKSVFTRKDEKALWDKWLDKFDAMEGAFENDVWNTKQSGLCRAHCPVLSCPNNGRA